VSTIVAFLQPPLAPFYGTWILDPISVSRDKVAKRTLGKDGFKLLWDCASIEDYRQRLRDDLELAGRYAALRRLAAESRLFISSRLVVLETDAMPDLPATSVKCPVTNSRLDGRKVFVQAPNRSTAGFELRMKRGWLLVSERYAGRSAMHFPRSPVFRYYRAEQAA